MPAVAEDEAMRSAAWLSVLMLVAACHRQPAPVLEYGETVTYTSTANDPVANDPVPSPATAARATAGAMAPASDAAAMPAPAEPGTLPLAAPEVPPATTSDGEWTTTVHTGDVGTASSPSASHDELPPARTADTPPAAAAEPPAPRQWYKAKPW